MVWTLEFDRPFSNPGKINTSFLTGYIISLRLRSPSVKLWMIATLTRLLLGLSDIMHVNCLACSLPYRKLYMFLPIIIVISIFKDK